MPTVSVCESIMTTVLPEPTRPRMFPHRIDADLVEPDLLHLLPDALNHGAFVTGTARNRDQIAQEFDHVPLIGGRKGREPLGIENAESCHERGLVDIGAG